MGILNSTFENEDSNILKGLKLVDHHISNADDDTVWLEPNHDDTSFFYKGDAIKLIGYGIKRCFVKTLLVNPFITKILDAKELEINCKYFIIRHNIIISNLTLNAELIFAEDKSFIPTNNVKINTKYFIHRYGSFAMLDGDRVKRLNIKCNVFIMRPTHTYISVDDHAWNDVGHVKGCIKPEYVYINNEFFNISLFNDVLHFLQKYHYDKTNALFISDRCDVQYLYLYNDESEFPILNTIYEDNRTKYLEIEIDVNNFLKIS